MDSLSMRFMKNPLFAQVYEHLWRPTFTRLFSFGGTATEYALFRFGRPEPEPPRRVDLSADALGRALRGALARERDDDASVAVPRS